MTSARRQSGFTLIELLLVIGIIAILASIVIVAINPTRQLGQARDAQRRADVNTIINAIYQYSIDNNGSLPRNLSGMLSTNFYQICNCNSSYCPLESACGWNQSGVGGSSTMVNIRTLTGTYMVSVPRDPSATATATGSRYQITKDTSNRITVRAAAETAGASSISVTR
jgi:prepilin-type N-terminal cleavage/methylation domain-containing protein